METGQKSIRIPPSIRVSAILLAAGKSERMRRFKQLLPLDGKTFVECCVDNLLASRASEVIVVTGFKEAQVRHAIGDRSVRLVYNPDYEQGMATSIKRGFAELSRESDAALIALTDQPEIGTCVIDQIIDGYGETRSLITLPVHRGRTGHPILIDVQLAPEIQGMDPGLGLRQVVRAHPNSITYVPVQAESILLDFDYPEDYARVQK
ncbi:MAG TPA: nucleotidyltransferase family protein [Blastocatellia bacterium]|nr:nucleotidyltransferase family protein [Blastocatellia bacterium]